MKWGQTSKTRFWDQSLGPISRLPKHLNMDSKYWFLKSYLLFTLSIDPQRKKKAIWLKMDCLIHKTGKVEKFGVKYRQGHTNFNAS